MNAAQLLTYFDRLSDAPDALPRLRRFILDLAVRGKLVEQDPNDESASELFKRIMQEKARLVKEGAIRKQQPSQPIEVGLAPYELPTNWKWVRFGDIADFSAGRTPSRHEFSFWNTGDYSWVSIADMTDAGVIFSTKETISQKAKSQVFNSEPSPIGTLIMSFKLTIGKISRLGVPAYHNEAIISICFHLPAMDPFLFKVLPQFARQGNLKGAIKGATLNRESITNLLLPLPPLAEQQRIVAQVDELMALCDRLEAAQVERERRRDTLAAASLNRLSQPDADVPTFRENARFYLQHLPRLTARPEQIKQLRQTILSLAVRGKLVEQDGNDEPASELLKRIEAEKARLVKSGKTPTQRPPIITPEDVPFELPVTWVWARLGEIGRTQTGTTPSKTSGEYFGNHIPFIKPGDLYPSRVDYSNEGLSQDGLKASGRVAEAGSILMVCIGTIGKCQLINRACSFNQQINSLSPYGNLSSRYLLDVCLSEYFQTSAWAASARTTIAILNKGNWEFLIVPLPPLAEQHRIGAKVDELMALCDQMEAQLSTTQTQSRLLLEAVLNKALETAA